MIGQSWRLQIDLTPRDLLAECPVQFDQRAIDAEQLLQPRRLCRIAPLRQRQLPRDQIERVDADAELEGVVPLDDGRDFAAEEIRDRLDQFAGCRFILHAISLAEQVTAANRFPFPTSVVRSWP